MIEEHDHWSEPDLIGTVPVTARTIALAVLSHVVCVVLGALLCAIAVAR